MTRHNLAIASHANPTGMEELPPPPAEIDIDLSWMNGHASQDELDMPLSEFDRMQDEAELAMHLSHGRYLRGARATYRE